MAKRVRYGGGLLRRDRLTAYTPFVSPTKDVQTLNQTYYLKEEGRDD
ncbi:MAG: hypothetical protein ACHBN1_11600 [Heteroscytonema crispum UTEX LB 1556]